LDGHGTADSSATDIAATKHRATGEELWDRLGERVGWRPIIDACTPPLAFIAVYVPAGTGAGVGAAVAVAVGITALRTVRKEGVRPAVVALVVLLIAAMLVRRTGQGVNLFLPDVIGNALLALWFAVSILRKRPATATLMRAIGIRIGDLRQEPALLRGHLQASGVWLTLWCVHLAIELPLYAAKDTLALAVVRVALGPPMWLPVGWVGWRLIRRAVAADSGRAVESGHAVESGQTED
jgi:hypothetical protein